MRNKIVIVDQYDWNRIALTQILSAEYTIIEATNGEKALEIIDQSESEIAAILIDMIISQNDEFALLKSIQQNSWHVKIPVLVVCGMSSVIMQKQLFEYGVSECINQPFDNTLIKIKVSNIVKLFQYKNELESIVQKQTEKIKTQNCMLKMQADVYDALINERVYKAAIPKDEAFRMIINGECGMFSPELMECLKNCKEAMEAA